MSRSRNTFANYYRRVLGILRFNACDLALNPLTSIELEHVTASYWLGLTAYQCAEILAHERDYWLVERNKAQHRAYADLITAGWPT